MLWPESTAVQYCFVLVAVNSFCVYFGLHVSMLVDLKLINNNVTMLRVLSLQTAHRR